MTVIMREHYICVLPLPALPWCNIKLQPLCLRNILCLGFLMAIHLQYYYRGTIIHNYLLCITQYGSTVYIGIAMGCPAL